MLGYNIEIKEITGYNVENRKKKYWQIQVLGQPYCLQPNRTHLGCIWYY